MDIDFGPIHVQGRARPPPLIEYIRDLNPSDLVLLAAERGIAAPTIKHLRDSHHALARTLARGAESAEASLVTGYSLSRISILKADPSFQELLAFYREKTAEIYTDTHARMATLSLNAIAELQDRIEEDPDQFTPTTLLEVAKFGTDRTGFGPTSRNVNVNLNVDVASKLERARLRAIEHRRAESSAGRSGVESTEREVKSAGGEE